MDDLADRQCGAGAKETGPINRDHQTCLLRHQVPHMSTRIAIPLRLPNEQLVEMDASRPSWLAIPRGSEIKYGAWSPKKLAQFARSETSVDRLRAAQIFCGIGVVRIELQAPRQIAKSPARSVLDGGK